MSALLTKVLLRKTRPVFCFPYLVSRDVSVLLPGSDCTCSAAEKITDSIQACSWARSSWFARYHVIRENTAAHFHLLDSQNTCLSTAIRRSSGPLHSLYVLEQSILACSVYNLLHSLSSLATVHRLLMSPGHRKNALPTATLLGVPWKEWLTIFQSQDSYQIESNGFKEWPG